MRGKALLLLMLICIGSLIYGVLEIRKVGACEARIAVLEDSLTVALEHSVEVHDVVSVELQKQGVSIDWRFEGDELVVDIVDDSKASHIVTPADLVQSVFFAYIEAGETTESAHNRFAMKSALEQLQESPSIEAIELLVECWMYYDPTDFDTRGLCEQVFLLHNEMTAVAITNRQEHKKDWERADGAPFSELNALLEKIKS